ncbi:glycosyltransferase family 4 protein [Tomitella fengzijianii]|uniref:glycosyltransferase family 4 protein n=1 Tax=Tomitella fengzijianii TaxID=2597660 RepID=UPI001E5B6715|nr:glycosyltransferase family 4 protein [Tomitella fengzijianii]
MTGVDLAIERAGGAGPVREVLLLCWRDSGHPQGGGSERYLEQVGEQLARRGVRVTLRTAGYPGAPARGRLGSIGVSRGGGRITVYPRALAAIALGRIGVGPLRGARPDVIVDTQNGIPFFAALVAGAPVAVLVHHCHKEQWPVAGRALGRLGWWLESVASPRLHRRRQYLTVSLPSAEELETLGVEGERIAVVRAGLDPVPAAVTPGCAVSRTAHPSLVVLSRLVPHKQIEDAMYALARLRPLMPDLRLDVIGDGWWSEPLHRHARELGVADAVTFHGHVSEEHKHRLLAQSWVHVMPSRKEGWGLVVVEAAQHEVPTVGYRGSRGLTDSVLDGVTGLLVDDREELVAAVSELVGDANLRAELGRKARTRVQEFSWERSGEAFLGVLDEVAKGRRVSGLVGARPQQERPVPVIDPALAAVPVLAEASAPAVDPAR